MWSDSRPLHRAGRLAAPSIRLPSHKYQCWNSNFSGCDYKMNQAGLPRLGRPWHHWPACGRQKPPEGALQLNERIVTFQIVAELLRGLGAESVLATLVSLACCSPRVALCLHSPASLFPLPEFPPSTQSQFSPSAGYSPSVGYSVLSHYFPHLFQGRIFSFQE